MDGYRLRSAHGDTIDPRQPLPIDTVEAQETSSVAPTLTYNGKAAAGAISIGSVALKPIIEALGSRVGSFWGLPQNKVYAAFADGNSQKTTSWLTSVTETNGAAAITIYEPDRNLEEMFESLTATVKRFIVKVYDKSGGTLYGWARGVSVTANVYTFEIFNNRLTEGAQNWVGSLAGFDNTALSKVEIYFYNSSIAFGTGTCFTEEVECPKEYSKNREQQLLYAETLSNGQYFVDYMRGELIGVKADATASEVVTYNVWASTAGGSGGPASNVNVEKIGGNAVTAGAGAVAAGTPRVTLASDDPAVAKLGTIDTDTGNIATSVAQIPTKGTALMAGSTPITLATDDTQYGAVGAASDVDGNVHGQLRYIGESVDGLETSATSIDGKIPAKGTALMAASTPVTLATDDTQFGSVGAASDVDGNIHGQLRYIGESVDNLPALGTAIMTGSLPVTMATDDILSLVSHVQDGAVGATDRGIPGLSKRVTTLAAVTPAAGDYVFEQVDDNGAKWIKEGYAPQAEDNTNGVIATQNRPLAVSTYAWSTDNSAALEASTVTKASAGTLRSVDGRINSTHASNTYFLHCANAASLPADGAVTLLRHPKKIQHTIGADSLFSIDCTDNGIHASAGIVVYLSTTEFTKTLSGAFLSMTVLFK